MPHEYFHHTGIRVQWSGASATGARRLEAADSGFFGVSTGFRRMRRGLLAEGLLSADAEGRRSRRLFWCQGSRPVPLDGRPRLQTRGRLGRRPKQGYLRPSRKATVARALPAAHYRTLELPEGLDPGT